MFLIICFSVAEPVDFCVAPAPASAAAPTIVLIYFLKINNFHDFKRHKLSSEFSFE
jgi:hypothetical protein